jgi:transcriptional regulator with GAF, ATPase, and Fis domain
MTPTNPIKTATFEPLTLALSTGASGRLWLVHPAGLAFGGPDSDRVFLVLGQDPVVLGRAPPADPGLLAQGSVSREHLRLSWDARARSHTVTDLESHNGTWVDGVRLPRGGSSLLEDQAVLRLGGVVLVYERGPFDSSTDTGPAGTRVHLAERLPGVSRPMTALRRQVALAGADPSPVLILGQTGAGKEHVARVLHELSARPGPLIAVNVSELAPQLVESQLFGHVKGAFSGADRPSEGLFRAAERGTLFLDEIGELPLELQPKLLRVLQEREVRPVGATRAQPVDVRILAATHRDLAGDVERGRFRRDLLARLSLWELAVPPLSSRRADLMGWVDRLHAHWCELRERRPWQLSLEADAVEHLLLLPFHDNLRGLDRLVHRLAAEGPRAPFTLAELVASLPAVTPRAKDAPGQSPHGNDPPAPTPTVKRPPPRSRDELLEVIAACGDNMQAVARHYGRDRRQVYRWLEAFGIPRGEGGS